MIENQELAARDTIRVAGPQTTFVRWSGFALIGWALHLLIRDFTFAFTHGSTEGAMGRTFLGLDGLSYAALWTPFPLLGLVGLAGVYLRVAPRLSTIGKAGFVGAFLGLALSFTATVMQYWVVDINTYFHSPVVYGGWLLSLAAVFVLAAGLVLAGIDIRRADALPRGRSLVLLIGILLVPTGLLVGYWVGHNDGSLSAQLVYGAISVPYDLCWLRLGVLLLAATPAALDPR